VRTIAEHAENAKKGLKIKFVALFFEKFSAVTAILCG
jgi:hypothetical protein